MSVEQHKTVLASKAVLRSAEYKAYLDSPHWASIRAAALVRAGNRCQSMTHKLRCDVSEDLDVHHTAYEHFGHESLDDLLVLCRFHHLAAHMALVRCEFCDKGFFRDEEEAEFYAKKALDLYKRIPDWREVLGGFPRCPRCVYLHGSKKHTRLDRVITLRAIRAADRYVGKLRKKRNLWP